MIARAAARLRQTRHHLLASETALDGGSLGWRKGTELPTFLADVIARMKPGDVSEIIQTPSGFHIVKLNETRAAGGAQIIQQVHLRTSCSRPLKSRMTPRCGRSSRTCAIRSSQARRLRGAGQDQLAGCQLRHQRRRPGLDAGRCLRAEFAATADSLKPDEISSRFARNTLAHRADARHRDFDNTADAARERAFEALRDSRVEEATELWLQQIRDESYVELRL